MSSKPAAALSVLALSLAAVACGGDDDEGSDVSGDVEVDEGAADGGVDDGGGSDDAEDGGGDPGEGSSDAWTPEELERLATETTVDGFDAGEPSVNAGLATVQYTETTPEGPVAIEALVTLSPCDSFICFDPEMEVTDDRMQGILSSLAPVHIENPDLVAEVGTAELAPGATAFTTFFLSYIDEDGSRTSAHRYSATYHDGTNFMVLTISPEFAGFDIAESAADLEAQMDEARGLDVAQTIFAAFADQFDIG